MDDDRTKARGPARQVLREKNPRSTSMRGHTPATAYVVGDPRVKRSPHNLDVEGRKAYKAALRELRDHLGLKTLSDLTVYLALGGPTGLLGVTSSRGPRTLGNALITINRDIPRRTS